MKMLILFFSLFIMNNSISQTKFKFGFELGASVATFPIITKEEKFNAVSIDKVLPLLSPIIGVKGQLDVKKHFYLSLGLQYNATGVKKHYKSSGSSPDFYEEEEDFYTFKFETIDKKVYHKVDIPILIGFQFKCKNKIQPSIFIGYTPNFYLYGKHYTKYFSERSNNHNNYDFESTHNPLDSETNYNAVKRYHKQTTVGVSALINRKIKLDLTFNYGQTFTYNKYEPFGGCGTANHSQTSFSGSDLGISLIYFVK